MCIGETARAFRAAQRRFFDEAVLLRAGTALRARGAGLRVGFAAGPRCFEGAGFFAAGRALVFGGGAGAAFAGAGAGGGGGGGGAAATTGAGFGGSATIVAAGPRTREGDESMDMRTRSNPSADGR